MADSTPKQVPPYGLRMAPELKVRVQSAAAANNRSMNAEILATLETAYPAPQPMDSDLLAEAIARAERIDRELDRCLDEIELAKDLDEVQELAERWRGLTLIQKEVREFLTDSFNRQVAEVQANKTKQ